MSLLLHITNGELDDPGREMEAAGEESESCALMFIYKTSVLCRVIT